MRGFVEGGGGQVTITVRDADREPGPMRVDHTNLFFSLTRQEAMEFVGVIADAFEGGNATARVHIEAARGALLYVRKDYLGKEID